MYATSPSQVALLLSKCEGVAPPCNCTLLYTSPRSSRNSNNSSAPTKIAFFIISHNFVHTQHHNISPMVDLPEENTPPFQYIQLSS